ncbi:MAG: glutamyl-tRNA reductase [Rhodospirillales bacterium]|nr:glutamyl-tRNA reductase [Rhodospirillales bacterium]
MTRSIAQPVCTLVVGANHRTSSLAIRDRLFVALEAMPAFLCRLRDEGIAQAIVVSTCDRVEIPAIHDDLEAAAQRIVGVLARHAETSPADLQKHLHILSGSAALRHLFGLAASLESLIVGEPHVLGQIKASHRAARDVGMTGPELESVLQSSYAAAKRVRTETSIAERPVSIAAAATSLAQDLHGDLDDRIGLVMGTGDLGGTIAESLTCAGLGHLSITHPIMSRAESMATALNCHVTDFADLARELTRADIIVGSLGARRYSITDDLIKASLKARRNRPMFIIDVAIPGDVDPAVDRMDGAFLYTLDDLERVALKGKALRENEVLAARRIIDDAVADYLRDHAERQAVPMLSALHGYFEDVRQQTVADAGDDVEKATRLLTHRLLHGPSEVLRAIAANEGDGEAGLASLERALARLFGLQGRDREKRK